MRPILILRKNILFMTFFMVIMIVVDGMFGDQTLFKFIGLTFFVLSIMCCLRKSFIKIDNIFNPINKFIYKQNNNIFIRNKIINTICFFVVSIIMFLISEIINNNHFFIAKSMYFFILLIIFISVINLSNIILFKAIKNLKYCNITSSIITIISLIIFVFMINYYSNTNLSFNDFKLYYSIVEMKFV